MAKACCWFHKWKRQPAIPQLLPLLPTFGLFHPSGWKGEGHPGHAKYGFSCHGPWLSSSSSSGVCRDVPWFLELWHRVSTFGRLAAHRGQHDLHTTVTQVCLPTAPLLQERRYLIHKGELIPHPFQPLPSLLARFKCHIYFS